MKKKQVFRIKDLEYFGEVNKKGDPHGKGYHWTFTPFIIISQV